MPKKYKSPWARNAGGPNTQKKPQPQQVQPDYQSDDSLTLDTPALPPLSPLSSESEDERGEKPIRECIRVSFVQKYKYPEDAMHRYEVYDSYTRPSNTTVSGLTPATEIEHELNLTAFKSRKTQDDERERDLRLASGRAKRELSPARNYADWKRASQGHLQLNVGSNVGYQQLNHPSEPISSDTTGLNARDERRYIDRRVSPAVVYRGGTDGHRGIGMHRRNGMPRTRLKVEPAASDGDEELPPTSPRPATLLSTDPPSPSSVSQQQTSRLSSRHTSYSASTASEFNSSQPSERDEDSDGGSSLHESVFETPVLCFVNPKTNWKS